MDIIEKIFHPTEEDGLYYTDSLKDYGFGKAALFNSQPDNDAIEKLAVKSDVGQLVLVDVYEYSFLTKLPFIKKLSLNFCNKIKQRIDFSPLYGLNLNCLIVNFQGVWRFGNKIEINNFPDLTKLRINQTLLECPKKAGKLQSLYLSDVQKSDGLASLRYFDNLNFLTISDCEIASSEEICALSTLQSLTLKKVKINSCSGLGRLKSLKNLCIEGQFPSAITNELYNLSLLEYLKLDCFTTIDNIEFIKEMPNLKVFILGCQVKNGDLSGCKNVPYVKLKTDFDYYNYHDKDFTKYVIGENKDGIPTYTKF